MGENMDKALKDRLTEIENILKSGISVTDEFQEINKVQKPIRGLLR
jgi:hypothetical protein